MKHRGKWIDTGDPFFRYTDAQRQAMSLEEYLNLIEESNKYVREKHKHESLNESQPPQFNSLEEILKYYDAIPFEEAINNIDKLFEN